MAEDPIDYKHLERYVAGDVGLTREVFGMFTHQMEMWGRGLQADADDEVWASVTHTVKGSAKAVGAVQLAAMCERAEALVGEGRRMGAREVAVQNIEFEADRVRAEIQRWEHAQAMRDLKSG